MDIKIADNPIETIFNLLNPDEQTTTQLSVSNTSTPEVSSMPETTTKLTTRLATTSKKPVTEKKVIGLRSDQITLHGSKKSFLLLFYIIYSILNFNIENIYT